MLQKEYVTLYPPEIPVLFLIFNPVAHNNQTEVKFQAKMATTLIFSILLRLFCKYCRKLKEFCPPLPSQS